MSAAIAAVTASHAFAADMVDTRVERRDGYVRINFVWPEDMANAAISADARVENHVLIVPFSREVSLDADAILGQMEAEAALARLDPSGRTLRVALSAPARAHVSRSYNWLAVDLVAPEAADPPDVLSPRARAEAEAEALRIAEAAAAEEDTSIKPVDPALILPVRRATSPAFDRIVFDWPEYADYSMLRDGDDWVLSFSRDGVPDLGSLRADPPRRLAAIEAERGSGTLSIRIRPSIGAEPRVFRERNSVIVDLSESDTGDAVLLQQLQAMAEEMDAAEAGADATGPAPDATPHEAPSAAPETVAEAPEAAPAPESNETAEAHDPGAPVMLNVAEDVDRDPETGRLIEAQGDSQDEWRDPVPESGVIEVRGAALGSDLLIEFPWLAPVRAAAFRRAGAIWIVFDTAAGLDVSEIQRGQRHVSDVETLEGANFSAVRIQAPNTTQVSVRPAEAGDDGWTFVLAERAEAAPAPVRVERRVARGEPPRLFAALAGAGAPVRLSDPEVGDTLIVLPAAAPARGVLEQRNFLPLSILPTAHGLAIQSLTSDVMVHSAPEGVWITPPQGLSTSIAGPAGEAAAAVSHAFIDFAEHETGAELAEREAALQRRVAASETPDASLDMARFLLERGMGPEALGALDMALEREEQLATDAEYRALRGVANVLASRWDQAERQFTFSALSEDVSAQLWLGVANAEQGDWTAARRAFEEGEAAIDRFTPEWRARFREAYARSALELNDLAMAKRQMDLAAGDDAARDTRLRLELASARWREAAGEPQQALAAYERLSSAGDEEVEARAILAAARLKQELGTASEDELIEMLESLRWRWRGDEVELETTRALGKLYVAKGEHRQGLEAMKAVVARFPDHPVSRAIFSDMSGMFRDLFLEGDADRMDPVEALALYFQFSELTPIGTDGDRMIRRLSERLVAFDLLPKAAELLQHQVDNRLHEPQARASVAADLALIYLMDRQPEPALRVLRATRVTRLPPALANERRIIEARALAELDANESALDLIAGDPSIEAARLRASIAWEERDWEAAGERLEDMLGDRWETATYLDSEDAAAALRAAVAYSLARDSEALGELVERYGALMANTQHAAAFSAVTQELETSGLRLAEIAERAADTAALESFLQRRRGRLSGPQASDPSYGLDPANPGDVASLN